MAQVDNVPVTHPVYQFLIHAEAKGLLPHFSSSSLPLQRKEVIDALKKIRKGSDKLNSAEADALSNFEKDFQIYESNNAVVFYSPSDNKQVLSSRFFGDDEKFLYRFKDSSNSIKIKPLGSLDYFYSGAGDNSEYALMGNLGVRLYGSLGQHFGYFLQVTNGSVFSGEKAAALVDRRLGQNIKFADLNSDFDYSESHVNFEYGWFFASIGREARYLGSGIYNRMLFSDNAPAHDALSLGAKFSNFEYRFTHSSLLALNESESDVGNATYIPNKFAATHRFALKPEWGEIAFFEHLIYSRRDIDLAYLNPLSFYKTLEHSLHDRDNSLMGMDLTLRPLDGLQFKATYLLDDIIISEIGNDYWSNKSAWNVGLTYALPGLGADLNFEYARVEPYTFSHFQYQNSMTNDSALYGSYLLPNSDETSLGLNWWYGGRYPLSIRCSYMRHGKNIYDEEGNVIKNVGADPLLAKRSEDSMKATFLDGDRTNVFSFEIKSGWEIITDFNIQLAYTLRNIDSEVFHYGRVIFRFEDFY